MASRHERRARDVHPVHGELDHPRAAPLEAAHHLDVEGEAVRAGLREHLAGEIAAHHLEPALGVVRSPERWPWSRPVGGRTERAYAAVPLVGHGARDGP